MRALGFATLPFLCSLASSAWGAKPAKAPELPPPSASLSIATSHNEWTLHVENTGDTPFLLLADARLVRIEFPAEGKKKPIVCALPESVRGEVGLDRQIVLEPKGSYTETFDVRFICFGAAEANALSTQPKATVHFGYAPKKGGGGSQLIAPYVSSATPAKTTGLAELTAETEVSIHTEASPIEMQEVANEPGPFMATLPLRQDADRGFEIAATITTENRGPLRSWIYLRPATVGFTVKPPKGSPVECAPSPLGGAPIREAFTAVAPKGQTSVSVYLTSLCPKGTFAKAGVYEIKGHVNTTLAPGSALGLFAFTARTNDFPMFLRVLHATGEVPNKPTPDAPPAASPPSNGAPSAAGESPRSDAGAPVKPE